MKCQLKLVSTYDRVGALTNEGETMKANILVGLAVAGLATAANAQSIQATGAVTVQAGMSAMAVSSQLFNDAKGGVVSTYNATLVPTANAAVKTYEVAIAPAATFVAENTTKAAKHIRVYYVQPTIDTGAASIDASVETSVSINQNVLIPVGRATVDSANATGDAVEFVSVNAWDFSKEVGGVTADGAQYSWNEVLVPIAVVSGNATADTADLSVQYVVMPTADAAKVIAEVASATGGITGDAVTGSTQVSVNSSGEVSQISGGATVGVSGVSRASVSTDAKKRRAEQRSQSEKALKKNK